MPGITTVRKKLCYVMLATLCYIMPGVTMLLERKYVMLFLRHVTTFKLHFAFVRKELCYVMLATCYKL